MRITETQLKKIVTECVGNIVSEAQYNRQMTPEEVLNSYKTKETVDFYRYFKKKYGTAPSQTPGMESNNAEAIQAIAEDNGLDTETARKIFLSVEKWAIGRC